MSERINTMKEEQRSFSKRVRGSLEGELKIGDFSIESRGLVGKTGVEN